MLEVNLACNSFLLNNDLAGDPFLLKLGLTIGLGEEDFCLEGTLVANEISKDDFGGSSLFNEVLVFDWRLRNSASESFLLGDNLACDSFSTGNEEMGNFMCLGDDLICGMSLLMDKPVDNSSSSWNDLASDSFLLKGVLPGDDLTWDSFLFENGFVGV